MDAEATLVSLLKASAAVTALVRDRIYPDIMPATSIFPLLVYTQISSTRERALVSIPGIEIARYDLDGWAEHYDEARALMYAVRDALDAYNAPRGNPQLSLGVTGLRTTWDDGYQYYHAVIEVLAQHDEQVPA